MTSKNARVGKSDRFTSDDPSVLGKFNYGTGAGWCKKRELKAKNHVKGHTPGSTKGISCKASNLQRYMAKTSRSYKHPDYKTWLEWCRTQR
jgi:hypothetical protein